MGRGFNDLIYENFGPDDSHSSVKLVLEFMIYFVGFLGTILALPQVYKIWFVGSVEGVSILQWIFLALFTPFWILYGVMHKRKSLVMTYVIWLVVILLVILGILING